MLFLSKNSCLAHFEISERSLCGNFDELAMRFVPMLVQSYDISVSVTQRGRPFFQATDFGK